LKGKQARPWFLALGLWLALGLAPSRAGAQPAPPPPAEAPPPPPEERIPSPVSDEAHYLLRRWVVSVELSDVPAARFRCSLSLGERQKVIEWDPQAPAGLQRTLYLQPPRSLLGGATLSCGSEVFSKAGPDGAAEPFQYTTTDATNIAVRLPDGEPECSNSIVGDANQNYRLEPVAGEEVVVTAVPAPGKPQPEVKRTRRPLKVRLVARTKCLGLDDLLGQEIPVTRARSFDPLTPVAADIAAVVTGIAVERARTAGARLLRKTLEKHFCDELTGEKLKAFLLGSGLQAPNPGPLLPHTCELVRIASADTLTAIPRMLTRSLMADLSALLIRSLWSRETLVPRDVLPLLIGPIDSAISGLVEGRSVLSERDSQLLVLQAAQIGLCGSTRTASSPRWTELSCESRKGMEAGLLIVVECIREGQCSADELQRRLIDEVNTRNEFYFDRRMLSAFGRAVDVFQPPPGTAPRATAKVALNTVLDILWFTRERERETTLRTDADADATDESAAFDRTLTLVREFVNALSDEQPERAAQAAGEFLANTIADRLEQCENGSPSAEAPGEQKKSNAEASQVASSSGLPVTYAAAADCESLANVTPESVRRAFGVLNTILAYSDHSQTEDGTKDKGELEKAKLEERRRAMQEMIDAATDRVGRGGDVVVSIGTLVGGGFGWYRSSDGDTFKGLGLSLPTGIAVESLPRRPFQGALGIAGWQLQLTAFDLSQYVASPEGESVDPELATAILPGVRAGLLIGDPDLCLLIGAGIGYSPQARFDDDDSRGILRGEISLGLYVPIVDLN
jgi:hypothetical protein